MFKLDIGIRPEMGTEQIKKWSYLDLSLHMSVYYYDCGNVRQLFNDIMPPQEGYTYSILIYPDEILVEVDEGVYIDISYVSKSEEGAKNLRKYYQKKFCEDKLKELKNE